MWKRFEIWVVMLVFALLVMPLTFLLGFYNTFFDKDFYKQEVAGFAYSFVTENLPPSDEPIGLGDISEKDVENVFKKVFTRQDFSDFFERAFLALEKDLSHVTNGEVTLHFPLDIFKGKQLAFSTEVADVLYNGTSVCAAGVVPESFECRPEGLQKPDFTAKLVSKLDRDFFSKIPSTSNLVVKVPEVFGEDVLGSVRGAFYWIFVGGFLLALVLLVVLALLVKGPRQMILKYVCKAVLLPAFLLLIFTAGLYFFPSLVKLQTTSAEVNSYLLVNFLSLFFRAFAYNLLIYVVPVFVLASMGMFYCLKNINLNVNEPQ